uniref:Putative secreted peptide n=1 Tax=Anopheles braziliensis TaxID=58242 RepID=A0A2M3ZVJ9_9DIPT
MMLLLLGGVVAFTVMTTHPQHSRPVLALWVARFADVIGKRSMHDAGVAVDVDIAAAHACGDETNVLGAR